MSQQSACSDTPVEQGEKKLWCLSSRGIIALEKFARGDDDTTHLGCV
jgi:hypothetical protein